MFFPQKPADPLPVYSATLSDDASRMVLRGRYHDEAKAWLPCLPGARWVPTKLCWSVDATPAAAWRLLGHAPFRVEAEAAVLALSARFLPAPGPLPTSQPELRTRDSWRHQIDSYHFAMAREGSLAAMWMGCVAGYTIVTVNRGGCSKKMPIWKLVERFNRRGQINRYRGVWDASIPTMIRGLRSDGTLGLVEVVAALDNGLKEVVELRLKSGKSLVCTPDHEIVTPDGKRRCDSLRKGDAVLTNGVYIDKDGYARIRGTGHPREGTGGLYEHIDVAEKKLGRSLLPGEVVHHDNEIKHDNRPGNLIVLPSQAAHALLHADKLQLDAGRGLFLPIIDRVVSVRPVRSAVQVYDLTVNDDAHAYVADGVIVGNTGKSKVAVDLNVNRRAMRTLVVCPVSVMGVWRREFGKFAAEPVDVLVLDAPSWSVAKKAEKAAEHVKRCGLLGKPCAVVVNYESAWRSPFAEWCLGQSWCMSIADEIHRAKGHSTRQGKFMGEVGRVAGFRLGLSGTPMAHSPLDLFGVARFIDRGIFGTSWHHFRNRYARCNELFPNQVDEWLNQDELRERLSLFAIHVGEDVLDLPEVQHIERHVKLDAATRRVYREFEKEMIAGVGAGVLTADNGLVKLLRLQQMTSGFVGGVEVGEEKEEVSLGTEKRDVLGDLLLDLPDREPVVVCCRFKKDLQAVRELAEILGRRYGEVSGSRRDLTPNGEMPDDVDLFGVQIHSGGVGIDLTRACYAVLYSVGYSLDDFLQFAARLHRPGQKRPVRFYHLLAEDSVDHAVYAALRARHNVIESVLSVLKGGGSS